jgi:competence protein ComEA
MKATWFVILSLFAPLSLQASVVNPQIQPPPIQQKINKINLNKADAKVLSHSYRGIGKKRAEAIVNYREKHGSFKSIEDLAQVRGIGKQFVKKHLKELEGVFTIS